MNERISGAAVRLGQTSKIAIKGLLVVLGKKSHHGSECVSCSEKCSSSSAMQGMGDRSVWKDVMPHASSKPLSSLHSDTCKQWRMNCVREHDRRFPHARGDQLRHAKRRRLAPSRAMHL